MPDITPFIRDFVLHEILGSHLVCLDNSMLTAAKWLGLVPENSDINDASEYLKGGLKKSEVSEFCYLLRCLSTDPKFIPRFSDHDESEQTMDDVMDRFAELQLPPKKKPAKPPAPKVVAKPDKTVVSKKPIVPAKAVAAKVVATPVKSAPKLATKPAPAAAKSATKAKESDTRQSASKAAPKAKTSSPVPKKKPAAAPSKSKTTNKQTTSKPLKKK